MLSSVNLPGGQQRMKTYEDQLQMRSFFQEHDLISVSPAVAFAIVVVGAVSTISLQAFSSHKRVLRPAASTFLSPWEFDSRKAHFAWNHDHPPSTSKPANNSFQEKREGAML